MAMKYVYICSRCNANEVQEASDIPSGWVKLEFILTRHQSKSITLHLCDACRPLLKIPDAPADIDPSAETKLKTLIKDIAQGAQADLLPT
jgi:hypothetical protein